MSTYATLRRLGQVTLAASESAEIDRLRRRAKADGLQVVTSRLGNPRDMSREQARYRPYSVALVDPANPTTIVAPDAQVPR